MKLHVVISLPVGSDAADVELLRREISDIIDADGPRGATYVIIAEPDPLTFNVLEQIGKVLSRR